MSASANRGLRRSGDGWTALLASGMRWTEVRLAHPDRWLVIEALDAHTEHGRRVFDRIAVVEVCPDGPATMKRYAELRRRAPQREFCFVHTSTEQLEIEERRWIGIRGISAAEPAR